jgi:hypothetical protein
MIKVGWWLCVLFIVMRIHGQDMTAPVKWQVYSDKDFGFSVALPKLPLRTVASDSCEGTNRATYFTYAEDVVYRINVSKKMKGKPPAWCPSTDRFDSTKFFERVVAINGLQVETSLQGVPRARFVDKNTTTWLFDDAANNLLIDLNVTARDGSSIDESRFRDSLSFSVDSRSSTPIGKGAPQVVGDVIAANQKLRQLKLFSNLERTSRSKREKRKPLARSSWTLP